ncbi:MAG: hypothetical protein JNM20_17620 [Rhizobiales bacterium]|nr:hypothetical protein [Hyphomicrobiales bacterium]
MTHSPYSPLVAQFRSETDSTNALRRLVTRLFGGAPPRPVSAAPSRERAHMAQPDGLAMLEREVDRIRLQSRHWLM